MQETLRTGRIIRKLYVNIISSGGGDMIGVVVKDNYGRVLEKYKESIGKYKKNTSDYSAAIRALEIAAKYCRDRVYIFTSNRSLVNHMYGSYRIKDREVSKMIIEIKFLEGFFKCVRFFRVKK